MDPVKKKIIQLSNAFPFKFKSVDVNLPGRLMRADKTEHDCKASQMSAGEVFLLSDIVPNIDERIVTYLETVGRLAGKVESIKDNGFTLSVIAPSKHRDKLADKLTWLHNLNKSGIADDRSNQRHTPIHDKCKISVLTGEVYDCRLIDMSVGGMAIGINLKVPVGSLIKFEDASAVVVRNFEGGIALEFVDKPSKAILQKYFMKDHL